MFSVSQWKYFHLLDCHDRSHCSYLFKSFSLIAEASCQQTLQVNANCFCWHHLSVVNVPVSLCEKITVFLGYDALSSDRYVPAFISVSMNLLHLLFIYQDYGGSRFYQNIGACLPNYIARTRKQYCHWHKNCSFHIQPNPFIKLTINCVFNTLRTGDADLRF